ncbi:MULTISPECIES: carbohydrate kinase family protein [unclassified Lentimonas]|uniref:carbohydrate kinase family protein n=1 Tax=unclassified Lentimonas TaxID=2630993 RepID=UPI00132C47A3|nr:MULTISPECIES: PfkB family carbohydrate kinase [unclassified Lentimonas]CAA6679224.1 Ribokinase (EC [Lentimonas sp. CC4]CAA6685888.1 Ribokinase (EC [Lentimonas sp. CC6]CAA7076021.1 Ribokinase (EC [Lentimonas sp. CC4]CAA7168546.1 Ribokinase (EC [Lentimonas sp. CC21]CAA7180940.1 Ribokinase (EC [Lentimonas sp. CC8]
MSTHAPVDVLCVGYACVDINFNAPHHPSADEKLRATQMHTCGGGPAANAAVAIARLGGTARFSGYLGNDAFGDAHLREFATDNVLADVLHRGDTPTPVAAVTIKPNGQRSIIDYRAPSALAADDTISLHKHPAKVLLIDGHQPLLSLALVEEARTLGIPTVLDAGSVSDGTMLLFNKVDYLITSEKFAKHYSGEDDPRTALAALDGTAPFIACTWGADGVYWQDEYGQHHTPAFDIEPVDTTGAGDAFHGAFALGLAEGLSPKQNMRRASATGALTCLKAGARSALPTRQAVEALSQ